VKYIDIYGESFGYESYVKFRHDVIKLEPNSDYESTGRWRVTARDNALDGKLSEYVSMGLWCAPDIT